MNGKGLKDILTPAFISSLKGLDLKARAVLEGSMAGRHASPFHGFSSEFAQYRGYTPGDDLKHLDWRVLGRSGQLVSRQYRDETNAAVYLVIDTSLSMGYGGKSRAGASDVGGAGAFVSKLEYARVLAASLALMAFGQRDAIGLAHGGGDLAGFIPPRNSPAQLSQVMRALEGLQASGTTDLEALFGTVAARLKGGSMTFLFTDLWQGASAIIAGLKEVRFKNKAVTLVRLLTPAERAFLDGTNMELEDMETGETMRVSAKHMREEYLSTLEGHSLALRTECANLGVRMVDLGTETPYFQSVRRVLQGA